MTERTGARASAATPFGGACSARFEPVRRAFEAGFVRHDELGAAVSVVVDGELVVDLWGGHRDEARSQPWERDTLVTIFSITKAVTSVCLAMLMERGRLDPSARVTDFWPEFGTAGKDAITVAELLSHRAGLPALRAPLETDAHVDWQRMTEALAAERPWWRPGRRIGYHVLTWGWLAGELLRRIDGRPLGRFLREEIAEPLGLDLHLGTPASLDARIAPIASGAAPIPQGVIPYWLRTPWWMPMRLRIFTNPPQKEAKLDSRAWRGAEIPASNGIANARSLARLFGILAQGGESDGILLAGGEALARATREEAAGREVVFGLPSRFGLGFMLASSALHLGPSPRAYGHTGAGGALAFADPDARVGFAYVPNRPHRQDRRIASAPACDLVDATYAALGAARGRG